MTTCALLLFLFFGRRKVAGRALQALQGKPLSSENCLGIKKLLGPHDKNLFVDPHQELMILWIHGKS